MPQGNPAQSGCRGELEALVRSFSYAGSASRIVFGAGSSLAAGDWVTKLGCGRAMLLSTPGQRAKAEALAQRLGSLAAGVFDGAVMHTPVDVTEQAIAAVEAAGADCLVALGGGSTIGLGKALAYRTDLPQIAIPTTYAGSEVTPVLGQTEGGRKTTLRDSRVLPEVVIYDPELTLDLPRRTSINSGLNAVAHAAEGLYAEDRNPIATLMAVEGLEALHAALPAIAADPRDLEARHEALYGAWLCGSVLGSVSMSLHHKLCHVLGGSFNLPHAETHAVMLPHTVGFNAVAVPDLLEPVVRVFGGSPGPSLFDFARRLDAPSSLAELGLAAADLDRAAELAIATPYPNPRPFDQGAIRRLLQDAYEGRRPDA